MKQIDGKDYDSSWFSWWKNINFNSYENLLFLQNAFKNDSNFTFSAPILDEIISRNLPLKNFNGIFEHFPENKLWFYENIKKFTEISKLKSKNSIYFSNELAKFFIKNSKDSVLNQFVRSDYFSEYGKKIKKYNAYANYYLPKQYIQYNSTLFKKWKPKSNFYLGEKYAIQYLFQPESCNEKPKDIFNPTFENGMIYTLNILDTLNTLYSIYGKQKAQLLYANWWFKAQMYDIEYIKTVEVEGRTFLIGKSFYSEQQKESNYEFVALEISSNVTDDLASLKYQRGLFTICDFDTASEAKIKQALLLGTIQKVN
jgi:hypothetical protein